MEEPEVKKNLERYLKFCLNILPHPYESQDSARVTILYFVISSLDLLDLLEGHPIFTPELRATTIEWIYGLQIPRTFRYTSCVLLANRFHTDNNEPTEMPRWGFRGSPFLGLPWQGSAPPEVRDPTDGRHELDCAHLATTYTAMCTLRVLGDDFSRIDRGAILSAIGRLQQPDGRHVAWP